jgi:hypothetical protein
MDAVSKTMQASRSPARETMQFMCMHEAVVLGQIGLMQGGLKSGVNWKWCRVTIRKLLAERLMCDWLWSLSQLLEI